MIMLPRQKGGRKNRRVSIPCALNKPENVLENKNSSHKDKVLRMNKKVKGCKGIICLFSPTGRHGKLQFDVLDKLRSMEKVTHFLRYIRERQKNDGKDVELEVSIEIVGRPRTLSQNRLLRALEAVMSVEQTGSKDSAQEYHEGLIQLYCPESEEVNPLTRKRLKKRTSELTTLEMASVIEGAFYELACMGVDLSTENIQSYWGEWHRWRDKQGVDPITREGREIDAYRNMTPFCEACLKGVLVLNKFGVQEYAGQMAHIIGRGAGGSDELKNLIHLCTECHIHIQHQKGWDALIEKYPHIAGRVERAKNP